MIEHSCLTALLQHASHARHDHVDQIGVEIEGNRALHIFVDDPGYARDAGGSVLLLRT